jgi:hypothetical protein
MPTLNRGTSTTIELRAGQTLSLSAGGIVSQLSNGEAYDFTGWAAIIGPYTTDENFVINAISADVTFEAVTAQEYRAAMSDEYATVEDLPTVGAAGQLYATTEGLRYWYQPTGQYIAMDGTPDVPDNVTAPVIAGTAEVAAVLSVTSNGVWDHRPTSFGYQWQIDGADVEGATAQSFTVPAEAAGKDVTCNVVATNIVGDSDAEASNAIAIPNGE